MSRTWDSDLDELILLPRAAQYDALQRLRASHTDFNREEWDTAFGESSLYEAWTQLPFMQSLYGHNRDVIHGALGDRQDWHIVEIGGGNGVLWDGIFAEHRPGLLTLIDPHPEAHVAVAGRLPQHVVFNSIVEHVEAAEVPDADLVVCSLTLHHVAGLDAAQRASVGFEGVGTKEILGRIVSALRARAGTGISTRRTAITKSIWRHLIRCLSTTSSTCTSAEPVVRSPTRWRGPTSSTPCATRGMRFFSTGAWIKWQCTLTDGSARRVRARCGALVTVTRRGRRPPRHSHLHRRLESSSTVCLSMMRRAAPVIHLPEAARRRLSHTGFRR